VKARPLVVDVSGLSYISSAGWAVLMTGFKAVQKAGGGAMLCGMSEEIYRVYDVMNVASVLPAANNPLHAAELLQAKGVV
jgi:anti-anti-sigma factor